MKHHGMLPPLCSLTDAQQHPLVSHYDSVIPTNPQFIFAASVMVQESAVARARRTIKHNDFNACIFYAYKLG